MMRLVLVILLSTIATISSAFTHSLWRNLPYSYTNQIGKEFYEGGALRTCWTPGGAGYMFDTNSGMYHGRFTAAEAEAITRAITEALPSYAPHWYADASDNWSFDNWFTNDLDRWPGLYPKAEWFSHSSTCGIVVTGTGEFATVQAFLNGVGEVIPRTIYHVTNMWEGVETNLIVIDRVDLPQAHFIKRRDRLNPLIVAEWKRFNPSYDVYTNNWECYRGWDNEFSLGHSTLFGLTEDQYPVFTMHLGGSNAYTGGLSLGYSDAAIPGWGQLTEGGLYHASSYRDVDSQSPMHWAANRASLITNLLDSDLSQWPCGDGETVTISGMNQRSSKAWLRTSQPWTLKGTPPNISYRTNITMGVTSIIPYSGDVVSLQYTNKMNTYEGTKVWDQQLLPEQLYAHYVLMTNMFLTPWSRYMWTNSVAYTSAVSYSSASNGVWGEAPFLFTTNGATEYNGYLRPQDLSIQYWQFSGCPWVPDFNFPSALMGAGYSLDAGIPPFFQYSISGAGGVTQSFTSRCGYGNFGTNGALLGMTNTWVWDAVIKADGAAYMSGIGVDSSIYVGDMFTGTPHRVHVYGKHRFDRFDRTSRFAYRTHLSDWITSSNYITPPMSCWSNMAAGTFDMGDCYSVSGGNEIGAEPGWTSYCYTNVSFKRKTVTPVIFGYETSSVPVLFEVYADGFAECDTNIPPYYWYTCNLYYEVTALWSNAETTVETPVYIYGVDMRIPAPTTEDPYATGWTTYPGNCDFSGMVRDASITPVYAQTNWDDAGGDAIFWQEELDYWVFIPTCDPSGYERRLLAWTTNAPSTHDYTAYEGTDIEVWDPNLHGYIPLLESMLDVNGNYTLSPPTEVYGGAEYSAHSGQRPTSTNILYRADISDVKILIEWKDE